MAAPALIQRLLARELARLPAGEKVQPSGRQGPSPIGRFVAAATSATSASPRRATAPSCRAQAVLFRVNLGAKDHADPRWLLPLICRRGGVTRRDVGAIRVGPHETTFEISGEAALEFADAAAESDPRAPHVFVERADGPARTPTRESAQEAAPKRREAPAPHAPAQPPKSRDVLPPRAPEQTAKEQPAKSRDVLPPPAPEKPAKEHSAKEHPPREQSAKEHPPKEQSAKEHPPKEHLPKEHLPKEHLPKEHLPKEHPAKPRQQLAPHAPGQTPKSREGFAPLRPRTGKPGVGFAPGRTEEPARRRDGLTPYRPARDKRPANFQTQPDADLKPREHARPGAEVKPEPHGKSQAYGRTETHAKPAQEKPAFGKPAYGKP